MARERTASPLNISGARGRVCLELTDPLTGKIKERTEGVNHVFEDVLRLFEYASSYSSLFFSQGISKYRLHLNDDGTAVDPSLPFMRGNSLGWGIPSQGSSGLFQGAANMANEILNEVTPGEKSRWKFQYEFLPSQANGVIRTVGLTKQYGLYSQVDMYSNPSSINLAFGFGYSCNDGRFHYIMSNTGIITKRDMYTRSETTIDVSVITGTVSSNYKVVAYAPLTGKYYVFVGSSTPANRKLYQFSDNTFSTYESTYSVSNATQNYAYPAYVYGNNLYFCASYNTLKKVNFVLDDAEYVVTMNNLHNALATYSIAVDVGSMATEKGIFFYPTNASSNRTGVLFDPNADSVVAWMYSYMSSYNQYVLQHPHFDGLLLPASYNSSSSQAYMLLTNGGALTTYVLPTPFEKTDANGMIVTYELEVYW